MTPEEENICRAYVDAWRQAWEPFSPGTAKLRSWDEWPDGAKQAQLCCLQAAIAQARAEAIAEAANKADEWSRIAAEVGRRAALQEPHKQSEIEAHMQSSVVASNIAASIRALVESEGE